MRSTVLVAISLLLAANAGQAADPPAPQAGDFVMRDFRFASGATLPEVRMHYRTMGQPRRDGQGVVRNAVLLLHGTTGDGSGFLRPEFAGELFGPGQILDARYFYVIIPDNLGHGKSSKPSDGLRARFPRYGYRDMISAQYRLLTEGLNVNHLRLVLGTSMGGMHVWLWGQTYPDFMDALMPLASLPVAVSGRNRIWRKMISDAIRGDPEWRQGDYAAQPSSLRIAAGMIAFLSSNPVVRQKEAPTPAAADRLLAEYVQRFVETKDANDVLYAVESSSDYDPGPGLAKITAPLVAINFADDLINPPELGILEREIGSVRQGQAIVVPASDATRGHGTHSLAAVWKHHLADLLARTGDVVVQEADDHLVIDTDRLRARINTRGYVSGTAGQGLLDKKTGARDLGFGLHVMDFLLGPGYRDDGYANEAVHGRIAKHYVEGPQICTQARELKPEIIRGEDFVAIRFRFTFTQAGKGYKAGSRWVQTLVFKNGLRYFLSSEEITTANDHDAVFYRIDMPGHLKHDAGDSFERIWLSYAGELPASAFRENFPPDARHLYQRREGQAPERMIRAYQVKLAGRPGPWLAGMTLDPGAVSEAWCHQRGYVCFIQELHARPVKAGDVFGAAYVVGWFDDQEEMKATYDQYKGKTKIEILDGKLVLR